MRLGDCSDVTYASQPFWVSKDVLLAWLTIAKEAFGPMRRPYIVGQKALSTRNVRLATDENPVMANIARRPSTGLADYEG